MKANRDVSFLLAALWTMVIGLTSAGVSSAGGADDYPGVGMGDKFLAAGPVPVILRIVVKRIDMPDIERKENAILLLLTQKQLVCRFLDDKGVPQKVLVVPAGSTSTRIKNITTKSAADKMAWEWDYDRRANQFVGDVKPPDKIALKKAPNYTDLQLNQFLYFTYLWLADMLEDAAIANDRDLATAVNKKAQRLIETIDARGLDSDVKTLLRNLKYYETQLFKLRTDFTTLIADAKRGNTQFRTDFERIDIAERYAANAQLTVTGLHLASLALGGKGLLTPDSYLRYDGLRMLAHPARVSLWQRQQSQDQVLFARYSDLSTRIARTLKSRKDLQLTVAQKLKLPKVDWYEEKYGPLFSKSDWPKLAARFEEIQQEIKKATPHGDPWLQLEIYKTQSVVKYARYDDNKLLKETIQRNAEKRFDLAKKMFELASLAPGDDGFKELRGELIAKAAEHALEAAELEIGERTSLRGVYSTKAVFALRLLGLVKDYKVEEVNRNLSVLKFRAMALSQMHKEALNFGSEFPEPRDAMRFHLTMARLHLVYAAPASKLTASREHMAKAIKAGFYDFGLMKANADLKRVLTSPGFVYENMTAEVSIQIQVVRGKIKAYVVTNNSPFAIFNGTFAAGRIVGWGVMPYSWKTSRRYPIFGVSAVSRIEFLPPRASITIKESNDINNAPFFQQPALFNVSVTNYHSSQKEWFPVKATLER